jgi:hypothetical protein
MKISAVEYGREDRFEHACELLAAAPTDSKSLAGSQVQIRCPL